jgi:predicted nucleic acid-binding protein
MILVDTSVWVDHFRRRNEELARLLESEQVLGHPFVIGELACGNLANRREILGLLAALPAAPTAEHTDVLAFIEQAHLHGQGIGWIDAHLLASAVLAPAPLWTADKRLRRVAGALRVACC